MKNTIYFLRVTIIMAGMVVARPISAQNVTIIDLGTLGGTSSDAFAINEHGQVVGQSRTASGEDHAFLWTRELGMIDLGTLGGSLSTFPSGIMDNSLASPCTTQSRPSAINEHGQVVGSSDTAAGEVHAFLWTRHLGMQDLGTLGGTFSGAVAINNRGQVAGTSDTAAGELHATLWTLTDRREQSEIKTEFVKSSSPQLPEAFVLHQNYPNPFNPETEIRFQLPQANHAVVKIFNTVGKEIRTLADTQYEAGYHSLRWDGKDNNGNPVSSGLYLYQLQAGSFSKIVKMTLLR